MPKPIYIRLWREYKPIHRTIDVDGRGTVMADVAEDGTILGIEILNYDPTFVEVTHDGKSVARWQMEINNGDEASQR